MLTICRISQSWGPKMGLSTLSVCRCLLYISINIRNAHYVPTTVIPLTDNNNLLHGRKLLKFIIMNVHCTLYIVYIFTIHSTHSNTFVFTGYFIAVILFLTEAYIGNFNMNWSCFYLDPLPLSRYIWTKSMFPLDENIARHHFLTNNRFCVYLVFSISTSQTQNASIRNIGWKRENKHN